MDSQVHHVCQDGSDRTVQTKPKESAEPHRPNNQTSAFTLSHDLRQTSIYCTTTVMLRGEKHMERINTLTKSNQAPVQSCRLLQRSELTDKHAALHFIHTNNELITCNV